MRGVPGSQPGFGFFCRGGFGVYSELGPSVQGRRAPALRALRVAGGWLPAGWLPVPGAVFAAWVSYPPGGGGADRGLWRTALLERGVCATAPAVPGPGPGPGDDHPVPGQRERAAGLVPVWLPVSLRARGRVHADGGIAAAYAKSAAGSGGMRAPAAFAVPLPGPGFRVFRVAGIHAGGAAAGMRVVVLCCCHAGGMFPGGGVALRRMPRGFMRHAGQPGRTRGLPGSMAGASAVLLIPPVKPVPPVLPGGAMLPVRAPLMTLPVPVPLFTVSPSAR